MIESPAETAPLPLPTDSCGHGEGASEWWREGTRLWPFLTAALVVLGILVVVPRAADAAATAALRAVGHGLVAVDPPIAHVDAVAVHGGGGPMHDRELPAAQMLANGAADVVVAMGGTLPPGDPDLTYAGAVERRLHEVGVDPDRIVRMSEGLSTLGEILALRHLAESRGWHSVALSSSPWHTRRVSLLAHRAFAGSRIAVSVVAAEQGDIDLDHWWSRSYTRRVILGEWVKIAMAWLEG